MVVFAAAATIAGAANTTHRPGVHNGVITTCVERLTKAISPRPETRNFLVCVKGARKISWNIRGPRGPAGSKGHLQGQQDLPREEEVKGPAGRQALQALQGRRSARPAASTEYGVAAIEVTKGGGAPVPHAAYSISLGSPVADTTGGVFRMTCAAAEAPCTIAVKAAALSDTEIGGTVRFIPRVLVMRAAPRRPASSQTRRASTPTAQAACRSRQSDQAGPGSNPGLR